MNWKFAPLSWIKTTAVCLSAVTLTMSPVAQGAAASNQRKLINQYLKETGLGTKKQTVGEFWKSVRHVYPTKLQGQIDQWVALNRNEMMPTVEASTIKGSDGKEHVRLTMFKDGQTFALTFTGDEDVPLKINGINFTKKELQNYNKFNDVAKKISTQDKNIGKVLKTGQQNALGKNFILTSKEYKKLTARQKAEYMVRARLAAEAAQNVYEVRYGTKTSSNEVGSKYEWVRYFLFGQDAVAVSLTGQPCLVAGYVSVYGENGSCGGGNVGSSNLRSKMVSSKASCSSGGVSCNPMVYGFDGGGNAFCVPRSEVKYATRVCNQRSPLQANSDLDFAKNKKRIIESYLAKDGKSINLELNDKGEISEAQHKEISSYLNDLEGFIIKAVAECDMVPLRDVKKVRDDQDSACNELKSRSFSLQSFGVRPLPPPPPAPQTTQSCESKEGSEPTADGKGCACPEGTKDDGNACLVVETGDGELAKEEPAKGGKEDSCGFWCRNKSWIIPVGIGVAALGLFWWLTKDKSKSKSNNDFIPPAPPGGDLPDDGGDDETPVITPPDPAPCPYPNTYVAGVCTPPSVVPPDPVTGEGGTTPDSSIRSGGVR